ncbi:MAG: outer membrane efflux protein [Nitrospirales bacterium]|nr:MAG: outer membrane efflux protein [Nitrospirales bacterium]
MTIGVCLILLSGCLSTPERDGELIMRHVPDQWSTITDRTVERVTDGWVDTFHLPILTDMVREALNFNHDLKAAAARVEVARANVRIMGAPRLPQVNLIPDFRHGRFGTFDSDIANEDYSFMEVVFNLSWELDIWGRIRAAQEAASLDAIAVETDLQGAALSLAARTAQTWFELLEADLQEKVASHSVTDRRMLVELVRGRFNRGLTPGLDLGLALTDLANAEAQQAEAQNQVQLTARRLEVLLGRYPAGELNAHLPLPTLPATLAAGVPSELLNRRPDIAAAMERLRAEDQRFISANLALLPRITLTGTGGIRSNSLKELTQPGALAWNVGAGLLQPIFAGDQIQGEIARNRAAVTEAMENFQQTALEAFREVEQALAAEEQLSTQEHALSEAVKHAQANQQMAVYAYRHGFTTILTLLDSFRGTLMAQSAHLTVKRRLLTNRIDLYLALGGTI